MGEADLSWTGSCISQGPGLLWAAEKENRTGGGALPAKTVAGGRSQGEGVPWMARQLRAEGKRVSTTVRGEEQGPYP